MSEKAPKSDLMEKIVSLAKRRGFVYQGSEIYGGLAGTWDYGPLGVALKNNIKNSWRKKFVLDREDMYEVDAALLMNPKVWETSGHVGGFADPMVVCLECGANFRSDHLIQKDVLSREIEKVWLDYEDLKRSKETEVTSKEKAYQEKQQLLESLEKLEDISPEESFITKSVMLRLIEQQINILHENKKITQDFLNELSKLENSFKFFGPIAQAALNNYIRCPNCQKRNWSEPRQFNMMFSTKIGAMEDSASTVYFRPETAQGMFVNFKNILDSFSPKLPFGMAQIGKAFRNEITPRDFVFRVREFEQMEIEYFIKPPVNDADWQGPFETLRNDMLDWMRAIGINMDNVHELKVTGDDLAHYSKATTDFEFDFPFGRKELYGLAYRTDFDLSAHSNASGTNLVYFDEEEKRKMIPHVIEPSFGVDRTVLALLTSAYREESHNNSGSAETLDETKEPRVYLAFKPSMAPIVCAVSPLVKNKPELQDKARSVFKTLKQQFGNVMYDDNGNIGKRYRRQDEIGTPFCVVIDFDTLGQENPELAGTVTVRDRDTGEQTRMPISDLISYIQSKIAA